MRISYLLKKFKPSLIPLMPILLLYLILVSIGVKSIDFGYHWDERNTVGLVNKYVRTGNLIPGWYLYPTFTSYLSLTAVTPYVIPEVINNGIDWKPIRAYLLSDVLNNNATFQLNVRKIFLATTMLTVIWVYLFVLITRKNRWEAFAAASFLGLSWEINYHARWIAPDGIMMQFGALALLFSSLALMRPKLRGWWLVGSAIAAGLATGTKYPGGLLILIPLYTAYRTGSIQFNFWKVFSEFTVIVLIFGITFIITTPGILLETNILIKNVAFLLRHYTTGHGRFTVSPGLQHLSLQLKYLSLVMFSKYQYISVTIFGLSIVGSYNYWKKSRAMAVMVIGFPIVFLLYFSTNRVMFVRNILVTVPFLAVLAARGAVVIWNILDLRSYRLIWAAMVAGMLAANFFWISYSAGTILDRNSDRFVLELIDHIEEHPDQLFLLSARTEAAINKTGAPLPANTTFSQDDQADIFVSYYYEPQLDEPAFWPSNRPNSAPQWIGPFEANLSYYGWDGDDRFLLIPIDTAKQYNLIPAEN